MTGNKSVNKFLINFIKLVPLGRTGGYSFKYYIKDKKFTKFDIINRLNSINNSSKYLPDDINLSSLSRDFLITVIHNINNINNFIYIHRYCKS